MSKVNKSREVSYEEGLAFAKERKLKFTETCAFEEKLVENVCS